MTGTIARQNVDQNAETAVGPSEHDPLLPNGRPAQSAVETRATEFEELSNRRLTIVFGSVWIVVVLTALDSTIVATLTAAISTSFSSFNTLSWLGTAYLVATAATQPLAGRLTDIFGRRLGILVSGFAFGIGTLLCGIAPNEWVFLLGRFIAGAGGGAAIAISTFIGADLIPLRKRGVVLGLNNVAMGAGTGLGGLLGGWLHDLFGWRWAFLVQLPLVVLGLVLCSTVDGIPSRKGALRRNTSWRRIDYFGSITLTSAIILVLVAVNTGGNQLPWSHPLVVTVGVVGFALLIVFVYVELYIAQEPVLPLRSMAVRSVWAACLTYLFANMAAFGTLYYVPIYLQLRGYDPTKTGLRFIPQSVGTAVGAYSAGLLMKVTGNYVYFSAAFHVCLVTASALLTTLSWHSSPWEPFLFLGLSGLGFGGMLATTMLGLISSVDHHEHAVITSASFAFRAVGSSTGITVASAIFQNTLRIALHEGLREWPGDLDQLVDKLRKNFDALWDLPPEVQATVKNKYMDCLHYVFISIVTMSVLSMISSLFMKQNKLHNNLARR
ncbi:hypothetical protein V8F33_010097 [Rhypophila sp. PSN 637]